LNPVGLLLAFERRAARAEPGGNLRQLRGDIRRTLEDEKKARRVFFRDERDLEIQLKRWGGAKLDRLLARLVALHRALLSTNQAAETLLAQELTEICRHATRRK
ncbi:MAG: DNA polymerase III subunit delta, partial [Betaproteobacteria bacterium]|nr:DNA polymerase III subunit delta [Betaproteobacteria bacterium]